MVLREGERARTHARERVAGDDAARLQLREGEAPIELWKGRFKTRYRPAPCFAECADTADDATAARECASSGVRALTAAAATRVSTTRAFSYDGSGDSGVVDRGGGRFQRCVA